MVLLCSATIERVELTVKRLPTSRTDLLTEIAPDVERLYNRHLEAPRLWFPHEQIDWGQGEKFSERPWSESDYPLAAGVRSSIYVNLLTEDNLPYYTHSLMVHAPMGHPIRDWNHQWTMEENRHAMVMRDWVHISRCIDPTLLEEGRRVQMGKGKVPEPETIADLITYVSFQERATQIAHRNTGAKLPKDDKIGRNVLALVAGDETKHYLFDDDDRRREAGERLRNARHRHSVVHSPRGAHRTRRYLRPRPVLERRARPGSRTLGRRSPGGALRGSREGAD